MFNRKAKRIAELEQQLEDALENLAVAVVPVGGVRQRVRVTKGQWYQVSFRYRHTGAPILDLADVFFGTTEPTAAYFTGVTVTEDAQQS